MLSGEGNENGENQPRSQVHSPTRREISLRSLAP